MKLRIGLAVLALAASVASQAQSLTTLFLSNNGGSAGGAVYFDVTVGANNLTVTGFDTNTALAGGGAFGFTVFTHATTAVGQEAAGGWTQVATGTGAGAGQDLPSPVAMNNTFVLNASTSYGIALVMGTQAGHRYTNGTGANQNYSNADLTINLGTASNVPFTTPIFSPRVWNGTIYYSTAVPEPATFAVIGLGALALIRRRRR